MIDPEMAEWLTSLIAQTLAQLERKPGLTCEVEGDAKRWVQVIPDADPESGQLGGILLNFTYHHDEKPLALLERVGMKPPPNTRVTEWETGGFARLWIRPDIPVVALALFVGDIIEKVLEAPTGYELAAWIEHGY
jgi:hypothetical protein